MASLAPHDASKPMSVIGVDAAMTLFNRFRKEASAACSGVSNALGPKREVLGTKGNTERQPGGRRIADGEDSIFEMVQSTLRRRCKCFAYVSLYSTEYSVLTNTTFLQLRSHLSLKQVLACRRPRMPKGIGKSIFCKTSLILTRLIG